jgi:peptidoglycan hydrolase-like protein with peptidoglycan-binding domain
MRHILRALDARRPAIWVAAAVLLVTPAPAIAQSKPSGSGKNRTSSWPANRPAGWSAGSVARGTGFSLPGASKRVGEVQRKLNRLGFRAGNVDGLFGPLTEAAVHRFQRGNGLKVDGIVGARTLSRLRSRSERLERLLTEGTGFSNHGGSARVRSVQRKLNRLRYGAGEVDGLFGPVTALAVRRFQAERGLLVDGIAGPRTLGRLIMQAGSRPRKESHPVRVQ